MMRSGYKLAIATAAVSCLVTTGTGTSLAATKANPKKGVSAWVFNGVDRALKKSGATWYYTWAPDHQGITSPHGVGFVPMIWGAGSVTTATCSRSRAIPAVTCSVSTSRTTQASQT